MNRWLQLGSVRWLVGLWAVLGWGAGAGYAQPVQPSEGVVLVVMDPLAKELACACVKGQGQRDYRQLAAHLRTAINQPVAVEFSDDLAETLSLIGGGKQLIIVGDRSRVAAEALKAKLAVQPVAELTGSDGSASLAGTFVVRASDPAKDLSDLRGRTFLFGLPKTDGKYDAALAALKAAGVEPAADSALRSDFTQAALDVIDSSASPAPVAVIPAYGPVLLTGCGSVRKGELRVIGTTAPVPFITVFVSESVPAAKQQAVLNSLLAVAKDAKLLELLESREGFKPLSRSSAAAQDWPDWRGPRRDGRVPLLPVRLPTTPKIVWSRGTTAGGLAGLAVSNGRLLLAERDLADENDVYRCLNAATGETVWRASFPASGSLDYGQSPRAIPVIQDGLTFLLGAFGEVRCLNVTNGAVVWTRDLVREFGAALPTWGMCSPPLLVDDLLVVNPGARGAALVALDCRTGKTRWATPGEPAAYSAFICGKFGGVRQIIGYDEKSLGGWDAATGKRRWQLIPPKTGDFNVPTPIALEDALLLATENNGARVYHFDREGRLIPTPVAHNFDLAPETATPVVTRDRVFGVSQGLHCLDLRHGLKSVWTLEYPVGDHAALIADDERLLVLSHSGELLLINGNSDRGELVSRLRVFEEGTEVYSYPALVGTRLYARGGNQVVCLDLNPD